MCEEMVEVLIRGSIGGEGGGGRPNHQFIYLRGRGGGEHPKKGNDGPHPKGKPGPGSFDGETSTVDSWDSCGTPSWLSSNGWEALRRSAVARSCGASGLWHADFV